MIMKSNEINNKRLEIVCYERFCTIERVAQDSCAIDNQAWRDRLKEELSIIRKRELSEVYLLLYYCVVPVAEKYPVTVRGRAAADVS